MKDGQLSTNRVIAGVLWVLVVSVMVAAWIVAIWGPPYIAGMLAASGCALSAVAAVAQIRVYSADLCRLVRVMGGLERPTVAEVRDFTGPRR